jgi:hypothetical protein
MNILKEGNYVFGCYASLENPYCTALVEFSIDYRESLGTSNDLSMMDGVLWELVSYQVDQVWLRPDCFDEHDCGHFLG